MSGYSYKVASLSAVSAWLLSVVIIPNLPLAMQGSATGWWHALGALWVALLARQLDRTQIRWVVGVGITLRCILALMPAYATHDLARYFFDGAALLHGLDPYVTSPEAAASLPWATDFPVAPEHGRYVTLYPPAALGLFALCAMFGPVGAWFVWKLVCVTASVLTLVLVADACRRTDKLAPVVWVALSPLILFESVVGAHVDVFAGLAAALLVWSWSVGIVSHSFAPRIASGFGLAVGVLTKLSPLAWFGPWGWWSLMKHRSGVGVAIGAAIVGVVYGAVLAGGLSPPGSLGQFLGEWGFGNPLFAILPEGAPRWVLPGAVGPIVVGFAVWRVWQGDLLGSLVWSAAFPWLVGPVVFPWYLIPVVVFGAMRGTAWVLVWSALLPLTYEVNDAFEVSGAWEPAAWPLVLIVGGWIVGLVTIGCRIDLRNAHISSRRKSGSHGP